MQGHSCCFCVLQYAVEMEAKLDQLRSLVEAADRDKVELLNQLEEEKRWVVRFYLHSVYTHSNEAQLYSARQRPRCTFMTLVMFQILVKIVFQVAALICRMLLLSAWQTMWGELIKLT